MYVVRREVSIDLRKYIHICDLLSYIGIIGVANYTFPEGYMPQFTDDHSQTINIYL